MSIRNWIAINIFLRGFFFFASEQQRRFTAKTLNDGLKKFKQSMEPKP